MLKLNRIVPLIINKNQLIHNTVAGRRGLYSNSSHADDECSRFLNTLNIHSCDQSLFHSTLKSIYHCEHLAVRFRAPILSDNELKDALIFGRFMWSLEADDKYGLVPFGKTFIGLTALLQCPLWLPMIPLKWMIETTYLNRRLPWRRNALVTTLILEQMRRRKVQVEQRKSITNN